MVLLTLAKNHPVLSSALIVLAVQKAFQKAFLKAVQKFLKAVLNLRKGDGGCSKCTEALPALVLLEGEKTDENTRASLRKGIEVDPVTRRMVGLGPRAIFVKKGVSVLRIFGTESQQRSRFELWFIEPGCHVRWGEFHPEEGKHHDHEMILRCLQGDVGLGIGEEELRSFAFREMCLIPNFMKTASKGRGLVFQNFYGDKPAVILSVFGPCMPTGYNQVRTPAGFTSGHAHAKKNWIEAVQRVLAHSKKPDEWPSPLQLHLMVHWHRLGLDAHSLSGKVPHRLDESCIYGTTGTQPFIFTKNLHGGTGEMCRTSMFNEGSRQASTVQLWNLYAGSSEGMHIHEGSGNDMPSVGNLEEIYLCLGGKGYITLKDGYEIELSVGDAAYVPACVFHGVENRGEQNFFLMVFWGSESTTQQWKAQNNVRVYDDRIREV